MTRLALLALFGLLPACFSYPIGAASVLGTPPNRADPVQSIVLRVEPVEVDASQPQIVVDSASEGALAGLEAAMEPPTRIQLSGDPRTLPLELVLGVVIFVPLGALIGAALAPSPEELRAIRRRANAIHGALTDSSPMLELGNVMHVALRDARPDVRIVTGAEADAELVIRLRSYGLTSRFSGYSVTVQVESRWTVGERLHRRVWFYQGPERSLETWGDQPSLIHTDLRLARHFMARAIADELLLVEDVR